MNKFYVWALLSSLTVLGSPANVSPSRPCGIYSLGSGQDGKRTDAIRSYPFVAGLAMRLSWKAIEAQRDTYDFSEIDNAIAKLEPLHQKLSLTVASGRDSEPDYIAATPGVATYSSKMSKWGGGGYQRRAVPWEPYLQERFRSFAKMLGDHPVPDAAKGGALTPLRDHSALHVIQLGIPGLHNNQIRGSQSLRIEEMPNYSRDQLIQAIVSDLKVSTDEFPGKASVVGFWKVDDGAPGLPLWKEIQSAVLKSFDGVASPRLGFFQENLAARRDASTGIVTGTPSVDYAAPLFESKDKAFVSFQALQGWNQPFANPAMTKNAAPIDGLKYASDTFGATYVELYTSDLDDQKYWADFENWKKGIADVCSPRNSKDGIPQGVFYLASPGELPRLDVLKNPSIDGIALRAAWNTLEPAEGDFHFDYIDEVLRLAQANHKTVSLNIAAGMRTPDWVYAAGAKPFTFTFTAAWGSLFCQDVQLPIPWDPIYLEKWQRFIQKLGSAYGSNPLVTLVKETGINGQTGELILPHSKSKAISKGSIHCTSRDDIQSWLTAGYTRQKVEFAYKTIAEVFDKAFPSKPHGPAFGGYGGVPPIDDQGNLIPNQNADPQFNQDILRYGIRKYGRRFLPQNYGLSAVSAYRPLVQVSNEVPIGFQMLWWVTGDKSCRMNKNKPPCDAKVLRKAVQQGIKGGATFEEIYIQDLANRQMADVVTEAHEGLLKNAVAFGGHGNPGAPPTPKPKPTPPADPTATTGQCDELGADDYNVTIGPGNDGLIPVVGVDFVSGAIYCSISRNWSGGSYATHRMGFYSGTPEEGMKIALERLPQCCLYFHDRGWGNRCQSNPVCFLR